MSSKRFFLTHFFWGGIAILIFFYILVQFLSVALLPKIVITNPEKNNVQILGEEILIRGFVKRTYFLKINGKLIAFDSKGNFEKSVVLQKDVNTFNFEAESRFGKKTNYQLKVLKAE